MTRRNEVLRAQKAFRQSGDTRMLKRELQAGNRYAAAKLSVLGLTYADGAIRAVTRVGARVEALYPNAGIRGVVIAITRDAGVKPVVVQADDGRELYFHWDQIREVAS